MKLPKGGFTRVKNSMGKQKKKYENETGFIYKCIYHFFTMLIKQRSHAINFVF